MHSNKKFKKALKSAGVSNNNKESPLHQAAENNEVEVMRDLFTAIDDGDVRSTDLELFTQYCRFIKKQGSVRRPTSFRSVPDGDRCAHATVSRRVRFVFKARSSKRPKRESPLY